jgi:hypothetical protein
MASPDLAVLSGLTFRSNGKAKPRTSHWPIGAASLRALCDRGLSDIKIAQYFRISTAQVMLLRSRHRIFEGQWKA